MTKGTGMGVPKANIALLTSLPPPREKICDFVLVDHRCSPTSVYYGAALSYLFVLIVLEPSPEPRV